MPDEKPSAPAPESDEAKVLAELEKEGHVIEGKEPSPKEPEKVPETPKEEPAKAKEDLIENPKKPDRSPTMVEAWKLHTAESQKDKLAKEVAELSAKLEEVSKQKTPVTIEQSQDIKEEIAKLAKDKDVDVEFLTGFADSILKKAESKYKTSSDIEKTVQQLKEKTELAEELAAYGAEFEKDVLPILGEYQLTGEALSKIKETLKGYAFSETYAKVPLKEIFTLKMSELNLSIPKKSSEGKAIKGRASDTVDVDNISEEDFSKLSPEKVEEFMAKKSSGSWQRK